MDECKPLLRGLQEMEGRLNAMGVPFFVLQAGAYTRPLLSST